MAVTTKEFKGENGKLKSMVIANVEWAKDEKTGQMKMNEVAGSAREIPAEAVFLAMGFVYPVSSLLEGFGVDKDARGNAKASTEGAGAMRPTCRRCSSQAIRVVVSRWWCGPFVKAVRPHVRSTLS